VKVGLTNYAASYCTFVYYISSNQLGPSFWLVVAVSLRIADGIVAILVEVPGAAVGVSLHEGVVTGGSPLVPLRKDTVASVVYAHSVHLFVDFASLTWKVGPAVAARIASFHELNDMGVIGVMFALGNHDVSSVPSSSKRVDAPTVCRSSSKSK